MIMMFNWLIVFTPWSIFTFALFLVQNLLGFVNFRLYHSVNVEYPPILDPQLEALAAGIYSITMHVKISMFLLKL